MSLHDNLPKQPFVLTNKKNKMKTFISHLHTTAVGFMLTAITLIMGVTACSVEEEFTTDSNIGYLTLSNISVGGAVSKADTRAAHPTGAPYNSFTDGDIVKISYDFTGTAVPTNTAYAKLSGTTWTIYTNAACTTPAKLHPNVKNNPSESWDNLTLALYFHPLQVVDGVYSDATTDTETNAYHDISSATTKGEDALTAGTYSVGKTDADRGQISANLAHTNALLTLPTSAIDVKEYAEGYNNISALKTVVTNNTTDATIPFIKGADSYQCIVPAGATLKSFTITLTDGKTPAATKEISIDMTADAFIANSSYPLTLKLRPNSTAVSIGGALAGWGTEEEKPSYDAVEFRDYTLATRMDKLSDWTILTAKGLAAFRNWVNIGGANLATNATLAYDMNLSTVCNATEGSWVPIGSEAKQFAGIFDGNGKTISNLYINEAALSNRGLFGYTEKNGVVKNFTIHKANITSGIRSGSIVGYNNGSISACIVTETTISGTNAIGSIVGANYGPITACIVTGVIINAVNNVGGISGVNYSAITASIVTKATISGSTIVDALTGYNTGPITASYALKSGITINRTDAESTGVSNFLDVINRTDIVGLYPKAVSTYPTQNLNYAIATYNNGASPKKKCQYHFEVALSGSTPALVAGAPIVNGYELEIPGDKHSDWTINGVDGLQDFADWINEDEANLGTNATLGNDIDLGSVCHPADDGNPEISWIPIGNSRSDYSGIFDGNGKAISGLYINNPGEDYQALFGTIREAAVKNLTILNARVTGGTYVGTIAGNNYTNSTITACTIIGAVIVGNSYVGAVAGLSSGGSLTACTVAASTITGTTAGAIVGSGSTTTCYALKTDVTVNGSSEGDIFRTPINDDATVTLLNTAIKTWNGKNQSPSKHYCPYKYVTAPSGDVPIVVLGAPTK